MTELNGFTEDQAKALIGKPVRKRGLCRENPSVIPGQEGVVFEYNESPISDGFNVTVLWGGNYKWVYETPEDFEADAQI